MGWHHNDRFHNRNGRAPLSLSLANSYFRMQMERNGFQKLDRSRVRPLPANGAQESTRRRQIGSSFMW